MVDEASGGPGPSGYSGLPGKDLYHVNVRTEKPEKMLDLPDLPWFIVPGRPEYTLLR